MPYIFSMPRKRLENIPGHLIRDHESFLLLKGTAFPTYPCECSGRRKELRLLRLLYPLFPVPRSFAACFSPYSSLASSRTYASHAQLRLADLWRMCPTRLPTRHLLCVSPIRAGPRYEVFVWSSLFFPSLPSLSIAVALFFFVNRVCIDKKDNWCHQSLMVTNCLTEQSWEEWNWMKSCLSIEEIEACMHGRWKMDRGSRFGHI